MTFWNKKKSAICLMGISLLLLAVFLSYWLHSSYNTEKENLRKDLNYTFNEAKRSIQDSLVQQVFLGNIKIEVDKPGTTDKRGIMHKTVIIDSGPDLGHDHDSIDVTYSGQMTTSHIRHGDSSSRIVMRTMMDSTVSEGSHNLFPMLFNWQTDTLSIDVRGSERDSMAVGMITRRFDDLIQDTRLPGTYEVIETNHKKAHKDIAIEIYHNMEGSKAYAAVFHNTSQYLINKVLPNILFALILFSAIAFSFYLIYSNWMTQQRLIEVKNDFISNVTHELKTPISTVSVALEALSSYDVLHDKEKSKEYLDISQKELGRLRLLVDKVLKMAIFEKGASQLHLERVDIADITRNVIESLRIHFENKKANLTTSRDGEDFVIYADKIHLTNVIYNLLDNALKYARENPEIGVEIISRDDTVEVQIRDNGIGIAKSDQQKIFERFYRVPNGDIHDVKGHGLGLSYVAEIVNQLGGKIDLESAPGEGSAFILSFTKSRHEED